MFKIFLISLTFIGTNLGDIGKTIYIWDAKLILLDASDLWLTLYIILSIYLYTVKGSLEITAVYEHTNTSVKEIRGGRIEYNVQLNFSVIILDYR